MLYLVPPIFSISPFTFIYLFTLTSGVTRSFHFFPVFVHPLHSISMFHCPATSYFVHKRFIICLSFQERSCLLLLEEIAPWTYSPLLTQATGLSPLLLMTSFERICFLNVPAAYYSCASASYKFFLPCQLACDLTASLVCSFFTFGIK